MSGDAGTGGTEEFAALLRELKDRSGLSYGALAKRLHMSTSTLHRYCHGTALPVEYTPVERLARVCRATPQELVELHRRWVLADAARALRTDRSAAAAVEAEAAPVPPEEPEPAPEQPRKTGQPEEPAAPGATSENAPGAAPGPAPANAPDDEPVVVRVTPPAVRKRRRNALLASAVVAAVLVAAAVVAHPWHSSAPSHPSAAAARTSGAADPTEQPPAPTSVSPTTTPPPPTAAPSRTRATRTPAAPTTSAAAGSGAADADAVPLTVSTRPYVYDNPCSQHFLVKSAPAQVGPPATEDEAPRWAAVYGAVSSDEQRVALTVQGTGERTVVLQALHVRVESKGAPLAWNDYSMGVGCGGAAASASFDTDLDAGTPVLSPKNGQRGFPYKVSESDPEVFYVTAHTRAHDVRWYLTLEWSSGSAHGTVRVDDDGTPFRTSADVGRPGYDYPLGWTDWIARES